MKEGFLIIKPDLFENKEIVGYLIDEVKNKFGKYRIYQINDYGDFCQKYREYDISNTDISPSERVLELQRTSYATYAYKQYYGDCPAYAVVVEGEDEEQLYSMLSELKSSIRSLFKKCKEFQLYVDVSKSS